MDRSINQDQDAHPHRRSVIIHCPVHASPFFRVVESGIEVKCRSCRGELHQYSQSFLAQIWAAIAQGRDPYTVLRDCQMEQNTHHTMDPSPIAWYASGEMHYWRCQVCGEQFRRLVDVEMLVWLADNPREMKHVCASCHKRLTQEKKIVREAK